MCERSKEPKSAYGETTQNEVSRLMSPQEKLAEIFQYHSPRPDQLPKYEAIRSAAKYLAEVILVNTPRGSDQDVAIRKLREAVMTANSSIALDGLNF